MLLERRLKAVGRRLSVLRDELRVADEQAAHFAEMSDDTRIRSLVSETPLADEDHRNAERTTTAMQRHRSDIGAEIERLEAEQDTLLDRISERRRS